MNVRGILVDKRKTFGALIVFLVTIISSGCSPHASLSQASAFDHIMQGDVYYGKRNYTLALQEYQSAISLDPNDWPAHSKAGQVLEKQGKYQEAVLQYRRVIAINYTVKNPADKAWWHFRLAGALSEAGLYQDALNEYDVTFRLASQDQTHSKKLASLAKEAFSLSHRN